MFNDCAQLFSLNSLRRGEATHVPAYIVKSNGDAFELFQCIPLHVGVYFSGGGDSGLMGDCLR